MLMSVDGKICTGSTDELDVDRDFPKISGVKEGLHQYYEIEQTTDLWSFNTGRVQAKMGVNEKEMPAKWAGVVKQFYSVLQGRHDLRVMPFPVSSVHPEGQSPQNHNRY